MSRMNDRLFDFTQWLTEHKKSVYTVGRLIDAFKLGSDFRNDVLGVEGKLWEIDKNEKFTEAYEQITGSLFRELFSVYYFPFLTVCDRYSKWIEESTNYSVEEKACEEMDAGTSDKTEIVKENDDDPQEEVTDLFEPALKEDKAEESTETNIDSNSKGDRPDTKTENNQNYEHNSGKSSIVINLSSKINELMDKHGIKRSHVFAFEMLLIVLITTIFISYALEIIPNFFYNYTIDLLDREAAVQRENQIDEEYSHLLSDYNSNIASYRRARENYSYYLYAYHDECMQYPAKLEIYNSELEEYNQAVDEYNSALQKFDDDCVAYEEFFEKQKEQYKYDVEDYPNKCLQEEKRQFIEFIKNGMVFRCHGGVDRREFNHVGNEWDYDFTIYGSEEGRITLSLGETVYVYSYIEEDDRIPDVGTYSDSHYLREEDFSDGFEISHTVYVRENNGRYTGNYASFDVSYTFKPVEDQFTVDESKYPEFPKEPVYEPPVFEFVEPVEPTAPPRPLLPAEPEFPKRPTRDDVNVPAPVRSVIAPTKKDIYLLSWYPVITVAVIVVLILSLGYYGEIKVFRKYSEVKDIEVEDEWLRNKLKSKHGLENGSIEQQNDADIKKEMSIKSITKDLKSSHSFSDFINALKKSVTKTKNGGKRGVLVGVLVVLIIICLLKGFYLNKADKDTDLDKDTDPLVIISECETFYQKVEYIKSELKKDTDRLYDSVYRESADFPYVGMNIAYLNRTTAGKMSEIVEKGNKVICYYSEISTEGTPVVVLKVTFDSRSDYVTEVEKTQEYWVGNNLEYVKFDKSVEEKYSHK